MLTLFLSVCFRFTSNAQRCCSPTKRFVNLATVNRRKRFVNLGAANRTKRFVNLGSVNRGVMGTQAVTEAIMDTTRHTAGKSHSSAATPAPTPAATPTPIPAAQQACIHVSLRRNSHGTRNNQQTKSKIPIHGWAQGQWLWEMLSAHNSQGSCEFSASQETCTRFLFARGHFRTVSSNTAILSPLL